MKTSYLRIKIKDDRDRISLWKRVVTAFSLAAVLFGPGLLADSAAMQWAGFILLLGLLGAALVDNSDEWMTMTEARAKLDELAAQRDDKPEQSN